MDSLGNPVRASALGLVAAALLAAAGGAGAALAGTFNADPVHLVLRGTQTSTPLEITNLDTQALSVRVSALEWRQENGEDLFSPTTNIIASPPIFTIAPGEKQVVRVGLRSQAPGAFYRILVQEIPSANPKPGSVQFALQMNLPLYRIPNDKAEPRLSWTVRQSPAGEVTVEAANSGAVYAQIYRISMIGRDGKPALLSDKMGVILPSSVKRWSAGKHPPLAAGSALPLIVKGASGDTEVRALVEKP